MPNAQGELVQRRRMEAAAKEVKQDAKGLALLESLSLGFAAMKQRGAAKKAVIFTESVETQKMLRRLLGDKYKTLLYHGGADHIAIQAFKRDGEILISTDSGALWSLAKSFFLSYNERNSDCVFVIDEDTETVTATQYETLPVLFYYWTGSRNRPYRSQKRYGMGAGFKPRAGQLTFSSIIGQGILQESDCAAPGTLTVEADVEPCQVGLYTVTLSSGATRREFPVLCGQTDGGRALDQDECKALLALPVRDFTEDGSRSPPLAEAGRHAPPAG